MQEFLFILYQLVIALAPGALFLWLRRKKDRPSGMLGWCLLLCFMIYTAAVLDVTGAGSLPDFIRRGFRINLSFGVNLIPFSQDIDMTGYILNIIMMVPLGFLLPSLSKKYRLADTAAAGFLASLAIELSQLLNFRSTDVDDLILNTMGAVLGYGAFCLLSRLLKWKPDNDFSPMALAAVMFAGYFLLYDGMAVAGLIYGF